MKNFRHSFITVFTALLCVSSTGLFAQNWNQIIKAAASDRAANDFFGYSVAISGDYAVVGAYQEDEDATGGNRLPSAGSAYIFKRTGTTWAQEAKIVASDRAATNWFGTSVAISGDYVVVGAPLQDVNVGNPMSDEGSAYIFKRTGTTWAQEAKIVAADRAANDNFGRSVAISGDYVVVGAPLKNENAAYIFKRTGTTWAQEAKIVAADRAASDRFGYSVAISGDYVVVGAYFEEEDAAGGSTLTNAGSAYIFKRTGTTWAQEAKIVAADRAADDRFGYSVAISGDYVVVGAYFEDEDAAGGSTLTNAGSAYIFKRTGTTWAQEAKIVASDRATNDQFGYSVAISGDYVVVGAYAEDEDAAGGNTLSSAGSAYFFKPAPVVPVELLRFEGKNTEGGNFLTWQTASEVNNKGYDIERSRNGQDFQSIGTVKGIGKAATYNFVDANPYNSINYYRLKQMDFDGKETLSKVISVQAKGSDKLKVYPNPVSNTLTIETEVKGDYRIFNLLGQEILRGPATAQRIDVSALPQGSYVLKVGLEQVCFNKLN